MELRRRQFITRILSTLGVVALGLRTAAQQVVPERWLRAIRTGRYPGPLRTITDEEIRRPSRWAG